MVLSATEHLVRRTGDVTIAHRLAPTRLPAAVGLEESTPHGAADRAL